MIIIQKLHSFGGVFETLANSGTKFSFQSMATGTVSNETNLVRKSNAYITGPLSESTFQQFISIFESFLFDLLKLWLMAYPQSLIGRQVDFKAVLDAPDKDSVVELVVGKELNEVLYERPAGWFVYLQGKVKLNHPSSDEIERFSEAKAARDTLVHYRGVVNKTYVSKAGRLARYSIGERLEISDSYHREVWELICKMVTDISDAALAKLA